MIGVIAGPNLNFGGVWHITILLFIENHSRASQPKSTWINAERKIMVHISVNNPSLFLTWLSSLNWLFFVNVNYC